MSKINEKLGVPKGIEKQADKLYDEVMNSVNSNSNYFKIKRGKDDEIIELGKFDIEINDIEISDVDFKIILTYHKVDKPLLVKLGCGSEPKFVVRNDEIRLDVSDDNFFLIQIVGDERASEADIIKAINSAKRSAFAHELKHLYDNYKSDDSIIDRAVYSSFQLSGYPFVISEFLHLLYYMTTAENLVRPSEIYKELVENNITKSDFKDFMKKSDIIKRIKSAEDFSLKEFKEKLNKDKGVEEVLDIVVKKGYKRKSSNADDILDVLFMGISDNAVNSSKNIIGSFLHRNKRNSNNIFDDILNSLAGKEEENDEELELCNNLFEKILNSYKKYIENPNKYFEKLEKMLNFEGRNMIRKLYKLYDMIPEEKNTKGSVVNWDLHTKINSKNEKIVLKFNDFKDTFKK